MQGPFRRLATDASARRDLIKREIANLATYAFISDDSRHGHIGDRKASSKKPRHWPGPGQPSPAL
jgi:hypothetical protein